MELFFLDCVLESADGFVCKLCGAVIKHKYSMRRHAKESHLSAGVQFCCPLCRTVYKTRNTFTVHVYSNHPELKGIDFNQCIVDSSSCD